MPANPQLKRCCALLRGAQASLEQLSIAAQHPDAKDMLREASSTAEQIVRELDARIQALDLRPGQHAQL